MIGPLQRPAHGDQRAPRRHLRGQRLDDRLLDVADRRRPGRVATDAVAFAGEVGLELVPALAAVAQEVGIAGAGRNHRMREAHHQRNVGVRARRDPAGALVGVDVAAHRADVDEIDAGLAGGLLCSARPVPGQAARVDLRVLERQAAEGDDQLGVLGDLIPVRCRGVDRVRGAADDVRQDHLHRRAAVAVDRGGVAAVEVEEAMQQALRMVEAPGTAPAVRAAVDGGIAVLGLDARELARRQVERLVPAHLDEGVLPACGAAVSIQPAAPHRRAQDAAGMVLGPGHADPDRRRIGIVGDGVQRDHLAVAHLDVVVAPMRGRRRTSACDGPSPPGRRANLHATGDGSNDP